MSQKLNAPQFYPMFYEKYENEYHNTVLRRCLYHCYFSSNFLGTWDYAKHMSSLSMWKELNNHQHVKHRISCKMTASPVNTYTAGRASLYHSALPMPVTFLSPILFLSLYLLHCLVFTMKQLPCEIWKLHMVTADLWCTAFVFVDFIKVVMAVKKFQKHQQKRKLRKLWMIAIFYVITKYSWSE
jgi:hypothetical protein